MKIIAFWAAALSLLAVAACTKCKEESNSRIVTTNTATLDYKECVTFQKQGLTLCFESANEYRCPCNAECFWEGACDVKFKLTGTDLDSTFSLSYAHSGNGVFPDSIAIGNAIIRVTGIVPTDCNDYNDYGKYKVDVGVE
jgi:hypothetical protein